MKKILALTLVLVLALGMMVPAMAATKAKVIGIDSLTDDYGTEDLKPGDKVELTYKLSWFELNTEADDAILNAIGTKSEESVYKKIIETIEPRFAVRSGGQIFKSIEIDNITTPKLSVVEKAITNAVIKLVVEEINANSALTKAEKEEIIGRVKKMTYANIGFVGGSADGLDTWLKDKAKLNGVDYPSLGSSEPGIIRGKAKTEAETAYLEERKTFDHEWTFDVVLKTVDPFVSVKDVDYEVDIYFLLDGKRTDDDYVYTLVGEFGNYVTEVDDDDYDVDSYKGQVIDATEYVSGIAIVGNYEYDITANVKMAKDKLIYFYVVTESDMSDEGIFDRYPSIEVAFRVHQVGLNSYTGNFIKMGGVDSNYYVYGTNADGTLKYLGRGGEMLPLSAKYYVSTMRLDLSDDEPVDEIPTDVPSIVDDYNPSTGI